MSKALMKTITWRLMGSLMTGATVFYVTRSTEAVLTVSLIEITGKSIAYYLHERVWG